MSTTPPAEAPVPLSIDATGRIIPGERALVLHGGGSVGNAWEIGMIAGLVEAGIDVTGADLIVGTSAGATAAAQITGPDTPAELLAQILSATAPLPAGRGDAAARRPVGPAGNHMERTSRIIAAARDAAEMRRAMGAAALAAEDTDSESARERWRATVAARLHSHDWPETTIVITAVDAETGNPVVFDRNSGVDLVDAVAASTSIGFGVPPYRIGGRRYIDGGYRRNENADLALGFSKVLVLSPFGGRSRHPEDWRMQLSAQMEEIRARGGRVEAVFPSADFQRTFGPNMMDLSARPAAAEAGYRQGIEAAAELEEFWNR